MAKLAPVFSKTGTITAGNSSGITDGAAAVMLGSEKFVQQNNLKPLARILAATSVGVDPRLMGIGPVPAIRKMEKKHGLNLNNFDLVELNEAFAAQVLACDREVHFDRENTQRQRRRHRTRPSHRLHRDAHHGDAAPRNAEAQSAPRLGHALRQRRHGHGAGHREFLMKESKEI